jgi:predicted PurR-regulated permease PerM
MTYQEFVRRTISFVVIVAFAVLLVWLTLRLSSILLIALLCWIISVGLAIPINFLRRRGLKRGPAVAVTFLSAALLLLLFVRVILPPLGEQVDNLIIQLPSAADAMIQDYSQFRESSELLKGILPAFTVEDFHNLLQSQGSDFPISTASIANAALPVLANIGGFLGNLVVNLFLIFFITLYFVLDPLTYYRLILALTPRAREGRVIEILNQIRQSVVIWIGSMVLEVTITALMAAFALGVLLSLPNALALGVIAGLGNIIPYIGYWAALIPILVFAAASGGLLKAVLAFVAYFIVGIIEANVILPANLGSRLKLPAGLVLISQAAGGALLGFWGVLLAVPALTIVMVLVREIVVFDLLGKRESALVVQESPTGTIVLDYRSPGSSEQASGEASPLTTRPGGTETP